jgi:Ulp1 family protease
VHLFNCIFSSFHFSTSSLPPDIIDKLSGGNEKALRRTIRSANEKNIESEQSMDESDSSIDLEIEAHNLVTGVVTEADTNSDIAEDGVLVSQQETTTTCKTAPTHVPALKSKKIELKAQLTETSWAGSEHVNHWVDDVTSKLPPSSDVFVANSFFYTRFLDQRQTYKQVFRWLGHSPFHFRAILIPIFHE